MRFLSDGKLLLRQAIAAWAILFVSTILFAVLATGLSLLVGNRELVVIIAFVLVGSIAVAAHIVLYMRNYEIVKIIQGKTRGRSFSTEKKPR